MILNLIETLKTSIYSTNTPNTRKSILNSSKGSKLIKIHIFKKYKFKQISVLCRLVWHYLHCWGPHSLTSSDVWSAREISIKTCFWPSTKIQQIRESIDPCLLARTAPVWRAWSNRGHQPKVTESSTSWLAPLPWHHQKRSQGEPGLIDPFTFSINFCISSASQDPCAGGCSWRYII